MYFKFFVTYAEKKIFNKGQIYLLPFPSATITLVISIITTTIAVTVLCLCSVEIFRNLCILPELQGKLTAGAVVKYTFAFLNGYLCEHARVCAFVCESGCGRLGAYEWIFACFLCVHVWVTVYIYVYIFYICVDMCVRQCIHVNAYHYVCVCVLETYKNVVA